MTRRWYDFRAQAILRDGDPGDPEQALGGFGSVYYQHAVEIEIYVKQGDVAVRDIGFDDLLQQIGAVLDADPTLGGLAFGLAYGRPETSIEAGHGAFQACERPLAARGPPPSRIPELMR